MYPRLHIRVNPRNPDHHLWLNNGTWFICYTLHLPDYTKARIRASLRTKSPLRARRRRDAILARLAAPAINSACRQLPCTGVMP